MSHPLLAFALLTSFATAAGPALAEASRQPRDACALVSPGEMARLLSGPQPLTFEDADNGGSSCLYELTPEGPVVVVSLLTGDWGAVESEYDEAPELQIPNLGQAAFWSSRQRALHVLLPEGAILRVSFSSRAGWRSTHAQRALAIEVARRAIAMQPVSARGPG